MSIQKLKNLHTQEHEVMRDIRRGRFYAYALTNADRDLIIGWMVMGEILFGNEVMVETQTRQEAIDYMTYQVALEADS